MADDDEVERYLKAVANQTRQAFSQGCGSHRNNISTPAPAAQQAIAGGVRLPARKKQRSTSPERSAPPPPPVPAPRSTASPKPPSLLARYFSSALRAPTLSTLQLPSPDLRDSIVARIEQWRARVVLLRSSVHGGECSADDGSSVLTLRQAKRFTKHLRVMREESRLPTDASTLAEWHRFLDENGPTIGNAPQTRLLLLLDEAESNSLMHVVCTKILRGQRGTDFVVAAAGDNSSSVEDSDDELVEKDVDAPNTGKLFINDSDDSERDVPDQHSALSDKPIPVRINDFPQSFAAGSTQEQIETLKFFRHIMPINVISEAGDVAATSAGLGVWFYAAAACVDLPVDPELDKQLQDLFKACCKHVTVLSEFFAGAGTTLLSRVEAAVSAQKPSSTPKQYWSLADVGSCELLALYTLLVILAKVLRQNQNNNVPI